MSAELLTPLSAIVREAGALSRTMRVETIDTKDRHDYVTNVDHALSRLLIERLSALTPDWPVLTEEDAATWGDGGAARWVVDPIDGTLNFMSGAPFFGVSVGLLEAGGDTVAAAVLDVAHDELFVAAKGRGAWRDDARLSLADQGAPSAMLCVSSGALKGLATLANGLDEALSFGRFRNFGAQSLHLCAVAAGRAVGALSEEAKLWDDAAGRLIAVEAGASYRSFAPTGAGPDQPQKSVCAAPPTDAALAALMARVWTGG